MELQDFGKIKRIALPENWLEEENRDESEMQTFLHPSEKDVKLSFYYRGKPVSARSADNIQQVLNKQPHVLSEEEKESIEVIIRDASEPEYFELKSASTSNLHGVMVLLVEGFWKLSDLDSLGVFVKSEEEGCRIDEIYYLAPPDKFETYRSEVQKILDSIEWN